ncbi:hypothetical protein F5Y12DRAFT_720747 [Xylaria sp. FL1777]|nr:hypothetical protein F5Y12DRAFT_720747 [Xylaria sp. FL1777]
MPPPAWCDPLSSGRSSSSSTVWHLCQLRAVPLRVGDEGDEGDDGTMTVTVTMTALGGRRRVKRTGTRRARRAAKTTGWSIPRPWVEPCGSQPITFSTLPTAHCPAAATTGHRRVGDCTSLGDALSAQPASWWTAVPALRDCQAQLAPMSLFSGPGGPILSSRCLVPGPSALALGSESRSGFGSAVTDVQALSPMRAWRHALGQLDERESAERGEG